MPPNRSDNIYLITSKDPSNPSWGTAFVIHNDETHSYLLTCRHVVDDVGGKDKVQIGKGAAELEAAHGDIDVAVLRIARLPDAPAIRLRSKVRYGSRFRTIGYKQLGPDGFTTEPLEGTFAADFPRYSGKMNRHRAWDLRLDGGWSFEPGKSGSPILTEEGECVAVLYLKDKGSRGYAISIDVLREVWPDRPAEVLEEIIPGSAAGAAAAQGPRMNLDDEVDAFVRIADKSDTTTSVLLIEAPEGMGKSRLLDEYERIAKDFDQIRCLRFSLVKQFDVEAFLDQICGHFRFLDDFSRFAEYRATERPDDLKKQAEYDRVLAVNFFRDLERIHEGPPLVVLIDQHDEKNNPVFREWLKRHFLTRLASARWPLIAVVAGQVSPDIPVPSDKIKRFLLQKPTFEHWDRYLDRSGIGIPPDAEKRKELYDSHQALPLLLANAVVTLRVIYSAR
jgi:hypothetical protein